MGKNILITGGAGFIGSHLANELLNYGYRVRVLDNLCPQVHGAGPEKACLPESVMSNLQVGDVRDADRRYIVRSRESMPSTTSSLLSASDKACMRSPTTPA